MTLLPVLSVLAWFFSVPKALKIIIIVHVELHVYLVEFYDKKFALAWYIDSWILEYLWLTYLYVVLSIYSHSFDDLGTCSKLLN